MSSLDPRTPVIVGVGQVTNRPDPDPDAELVGRPEPVELMVTALLQAVEDCDESGSGGTSPAGCALLKRTDSIRVIPPFNWDYRDPASLVAKRLSIEPKELALATNGGNNPQLTVNQTALAIGRGQLDSALIVGADCGYTAAAVRTHPDRPVLGWTVEPPGGDQPVVIGTARRGTTDAEEASGIGVPGHVFPLFENALRAEAGRSLAEHDELMGRLWSRFSQVAAGHPNAWITDSCSGADIISISESNRMVSFPYPKLLTGNTRVDQGAALIMCSAAAAEAAGVPRDRWVFPLAGADAIDHWYLSHRADFHSSPAARLAGRSAMALAGTDTDSIGHLDLYSYFPAAVEVVAHELGVAIDDEARPLTVTGGQTFFGTPGSNYGTHAIATMVGALRQDSGSLGMVTNIGLNMTMHSLGIYGTEPGAPTPDPGVVPENTAVEEAAGFRWADPQPAVDALPQCSPDADAAGEVTVETYTVTYDRDGAPDRAIVACKTPEGRRAWANVTDQDQLAVLVTEEGCGRLGKLRSDGQVDLR
jgi:acetyl-CoA C-acetyltransferase